MPDYLDGGAPSIADVQAIADHLSGVAGLTAVQLQAADLDADGQVTAIDLFLMARLAAGDLTVPIEIPRLIVADLEFVRPAENLTIEGEGLGVTMAEVRAVLEIDSDQTELSVVSLIDTSIELTVPGTLAVPSGEVRGVVTVLRRGVPSRPFPLAIRGGPVLRRVEHQSGSLRLHGAGFGTAVSAVRVRFADADSQPASVQDDLVQIVPPTTVVAPVEVRVVVGGVASNSLAYVPLANGTGTVSLPLSSLLSVTDLTVTSTSGEPLPVTPGGEFSFTAEVGVISSFEASDDQDTVILAALRVHPVVLRVDAHSTAVWLVYSSLAGSLGGFARSAILVDALTTDATVVALADAIRVAHPSTPSIMEQVQQVASVRAAIQAALVAGATLKAEILGSETGP